MALDGRRHGRLLRAQVLAGASAAQLFDSWAGSLSLHDYTRHVAPASTRALSHVRDLTYTVPLPVPADAEEDEQEPEDEVRMFPSCTSGWARASTIACATTTAGPIASSSASVSRWRRRARNTTASSPPATAPQIDSPPFQISNAPTIPPSLHL